MIMHIDMDAFFASVEQAVNPRLKGRPLIVGARQNKNYTVVCAASYEAKAYGVDSGMPTKEAFRLCPQALFIAADTHKYIYTSERILRFLEDYGLALEYASVDEFRMDLEGIDQARQKALAHEIKERIKEGFWGITCSIGIAKNCLLAKLASKVNKPNGLSILTEENLADVLVNLPAGKLCGVGPRTREILAYLGINTCLDLWHTPEEILTRYLGQAGLDLYTNLHRLETLGFSREKLPPKSIGHSYTLLRAIQDPEQINSWLRILAEMVAFRLREADLEAKTTCIWLNLVDKKAIFNSQKTYNLATNDGYEVWLRTRQIMAKIRHPRPKIRALGVTCSGLNTPQIKPLFKEMQNREDLLKSTDLINRKYGQWSIYPASLQTTRKHL
ncbi:MAG: DNA polymerase IV [Candidatus Omnitrophota bacterium]